MLVCELRHLVYWRIALWYPVQLIEVGVCPPRGMQPGHTSDGPLGFFQCAPLRVVAHRQIREVLHQDEVVVGSHVHGTRVASRYPDRNARRQLPVETDLALVKPFFFDDMATTE